MIIECKGCGSKFNLDETLLKVGGSKVRCSICKHVFITYPPQEMPIEEPATGEFLGEELGTTLSLDSSAALGEEEAERLEEAEESDFDLAFEEAMEEAEIEGAVSPDLLFEEEEEEIAVAETAAMAREERELRPEAAVPVVPKAKRGRSRVLPLIVLIILLILAGATAVLFYAPDLIPDSIPFLKPSEKQEITDPGVARLSFKAVTGSFIQSNTAGQLFVIKGMVTNDYPKPRSFIRIKGSILDDKGETVKMKTVYAGNTFTEKQIKEKPLEELQEGLKNRFGGARMNFNLQTGGTIPFMIILENLPENISEFTVEFVSSTPEK
ncbi:MAG: zinc-ribbon domain-containing protein [Deltaproteobacteria bacterium]|nr:MAG: zinc-ribbon domain-containing protein [Deltaproteobacteria bacterium]